jgi:predicted nuclease of restriction endonuclease-like RecB superfamily
MTEREAAANSSILNYLSSLSKLYNHQENFTQETERTLFSSWFLINKQVNITSGPKLLNYGTIKGSKLAMGTD